MGNLQKSWPLRWLDHQWTAPICYQASEGNCILLLLLLILWNDSVSCYELHALRNNTRTKSIYHFLFPPEWWDGMCSQQVRGSVHICAKIPSMHFPLAVTTPTTKEEGVVCVKREALFELQQLRQPALHLSEQSTQIQCPRQFFSTPAVQVWRWLECIFVSSTVTLVPSSGHWTSEKRKTAQNSPICSSFRAPYWCIKKAIWPWQS